MFKSRKYCNQHIIYTKKYSFISFYMKKARDGAWHPVDAVLCTDRVGDEKIELRAQDWARFMQKGIFFRLLLYEKSARRCMASCGCHLMHRPSRRREDRTSSPGLGSFHAKRDILPDIPLHEKSARRGSNPSYQRLFFPYSKPLFLPLLSLLHHFRHLCNSIFQ